MIEVTRYANFNWCPLSDFAPVTDAVSLHLGCGPSLAALGVNPYRPIRQTVIAMRSARTARHVESPGRDLAF